VKTGFAKIVNIDKIDLFSVQNLKDKFKQNQANQDDKSIILFIYRAVFSYSFSIFIF
jgi:hypothetical protein